MKNNVSWNCPQTVFLGLGANIKNPADNLSKAFEHLKNEVLEGACLSSLYITEPMDVKEQPEFINAVCRGQFRGSPQELLAAIHLIEDSLGRDRSREQRRGPRPIDIDILLFGSLVLNNPPLLVIPHERLRDRKFALVPLLEIAPDLIDPVNGAPYASYIAEIEDQLISRLN
ncbi:MAG: 2-amino-4-hydroxy-6-hydroxymethyldihydropteridine diphosphokinase [Spirochaetales bacterium]|nr:2-amino-4-hydroxy-6-hydroxymethyldihydropteridine diphosphokinase [Spirochaetales bacterium]